MNSNLVSEKFDIIASANTTNLTGHGIYNKLSKTVDIFFFAEGNYATTGSIIAAIPEGYRPNEETNCECIIYNSNGVCSPYRGTISAAGNITQSFGSNVTRVMFIAKYLVS